MNKVLKWAGIAAATAVLAGAGGFWAMEFAKSRIDLNSHRDQITGEIARVSGIQAGFARLEWIPFRPGVVAILPTLSKNGMNIRASRLKAVVSLPSLLFGPPRLSRLAIENLVVTAERDEKGRWNFDQLFTGGKAGGGMPKLPDDIIITNGSVVVSDAYAPLHPTVFDEPRQTIHDSHAAKEYFEESNPEQEETPYRTLAEPVAPFSLLLPPAQNPAKPETDEPAPPKQLVFREINLNFHGGGWVFPSSLQLNAELVDPALQKNPLYHNLKPGKMALSLRSRTGGTGSWDWNNAKTKGTISVDSIYSGSFDAYLVGLLPEHYSGKVYTFNFDFDGRPSNELAFHGSLAARPLALVANPALFTGSAYESRRFNITGAIRPNRISLDRVEIYLPEARLDVHMEIANYRSPNPDISFRASTSFVELDKLDRLIPPAYLNDPIVRAIRKSVGGGRFRISNITFHGPFSTFINITAPENMERVSGRLEVEDASFLIKGMKAPVKEIKGVIDIKGNLVTFQNLSAIHGHSAITKLRGSIKDLRTAPYLEAVLTANVNIAELREEALARVVSKKLHEMIEPVRDVEGTVRATVNVEADLLEPRITELDADILFANVGFRHNQFKVPVSGFNGLFHVNRNVIEIKDAAFNVETSAITVSGAIRRYAEPEYDMDLKVDIAGSIPRMEENPLIAEQVAKGLTGHIVGSLAFSGTLNNLTFLEELNLTQANVKLMGIIDKPPGRSLNVSTKGSLQEGGRLVIDEGRIDFGNSHIKFSGTAPDTHTWKAYDFRANMEKIDLSDGPLYIEDFRKGVVAGELKGNVRIADGGKKPAISGTVGVKIGNIDLKELEHFKQTLPPLGYLKMEGNVQGDVSIRFSPGVWPKFHGWLGGANVGFYTMLPHKLQNMEGKIKLKGDLITFTDIPFTSGKASAEASGSILINKKPVLRLDVRANRLDLDDIVWMEGEPDPWWSEESQFSPEVFIRARANIGTLDFIHYDDIDLEMHYYHDQFIFKKTRFSMYRGVCEASGELNVKPDKPLFATHIKLTGVEMEPMIKDFWPDMKKVTGKMAAEGTFNGEGLRWKDLRHTLNGTVRFEAMDGLLSQFGGIADILSTINITPLLNKRATRQEGIGLPFDSITANMTIEKGTGHTNDLVMEGNVVRMSAAGDFRFNDGTVKLLLGVKPFTSVDSIISHIPVAGTLLTGDQKSLVISYYDLSGPMDDPVATSVPGESVARAILGIFQRMLEAPAKALSTEKGLEKTKEKQTEKMNGKN